MTPPRPIIAPQEHRTPLVHAVRNLRGGVSELLAGAAAADPPTPCDWSALTWAAFLGQADTVERLAKAGADVARADKGGRTPLIVAAQHGHAAAVSALLGLGADRDATDGGGLTAFDWAERGNYTECERVLLAGSKVPPPAAGAEGAEGAGAPQPAAPESGPAVAKVREAEDEVRWRERHALPLRLARSRASQEPPVRRSHPLPPLRSQHGRTALMVAVEGGDAAAVQALLDKGADPEATDPDGRTPLILAISRCRVPCARALAATGKAINVPDAVRRALSI